MAQPDFRRSRAVLTGTATYSDDELINLPAVVRNITALQKTLTNPNLSGFTSEQINLVIDPKAPSDLLAPIAEAAREAEDVLLVYFAGHGLLLGAGDLYLGLKDTREAEFWTSVPFEQVAQLIKDSSALVKIAILDCCYSGRALRHMMADVVTITSEHLDIEGVYVLTSSSANKTSRAREGAEFTVFTGTLLRVIETGILSGDEFLPMDLLYDEVRRQMRRDGERTPQRYNANTAGRIALVRNISCIPRAKEAEIQSLNMTDSGAVLIATSLYDDPSLDLPSARNDLEEMSALLSDSSICGVGRSWRILNPRSPNDVLEPLQQAAEEINDFLIVYISGYSDYKDKDALHFILSSSKLERTWTFLSAASIVEVLRHARAQAIIIIIDSSYSGLASAALDSIENVYLLAATGPNQLASIAGDHGQFTGELMKVLRNGIGGHPMHLSPVDVFRAIEASDPPQRPQLTANIKRVHCLFHNRSTTADLHASHPCNQT